MSKVLIAGLKKRYLESIEKWLFQEDIPFLWGESLEEITRVVEQVFGDSSEIRVVITDLVLKDVGGIDFVDWVRRELPTAQLIVVGPRFSEALEHILVGEVENVKVLTGAHFNRQTLLHLIRGALKSFMGFEGHISGMTLFDFIQLLSMGGYSATIEVENPRMDRRGTVYIQEGQIVHAETAESKGKEALFQIMKWQTGQFTFTPAVPSDIPQSIRESMDFVLLEFARIQDEASRLIKKPTFPFQQELERIFSEIEKEIAGFMGIALFDVEKGQPLFYRTSHKEFTFVTTARLYSELLQLVADTTEIATRGRETREMVDMILTRDLNDVIVMIPLHRMRYAVLLIYDRRDGGGGETGIEVMDRYRLKLEQIVLKIGGSNN